MVVYSGYAKKLTGGVRADGQQRDYGRDECGAIGGGIW